MAEYTIQEICDQTGMARRTIHFYVQQGILRAPEGAGTATRYSEAHLLSLKLIPLLRAKGLRLDDIRARLQDLNEDSLRSLYDQVFEPAPPKLLPSSQAYGHYALPAGMTLVVPAALAGADRKKLSEVLKAIQDIFDE